MKNLLFLAISIFTVGCTTPEVDEFSYISTPTNECGTIIATVDSPSGDMIEVKMSYHNPNQRSIYAVADYSFYQVGSEICDFTGLKKLQ